MHCGVDAGRSAHGRLPIHRGLLQSAPAALDTTALATCRPGRKDALGRTKRSLERGGQNAVKPDTLIPRPHLSTKPRQVHIAPSDARGHSLVRPAPRAFFHPDRQISQPPRAGPVKAGRLFAATRNGLALIGPSTAACLIGSGLQAGARQFRQIQTGGFTSNSHRW